MNEVILKKWFEDIGLDTGLKNMKSFEEEVLNKHYIEKQRARDVIDKHTIKNCDGEDYIACPPEVLKKEMRID